MSVTGSPGLEVPRNITLGRKGYPDTRAQSSFQVPPVSEKQTHSKKDDSGVRYRLTAYGNRRAFPGHYVRDRNVRSGDRTCPYAGGLRAYFKRQVGDRDADAF